MSLAKRIIPCMDVKNGRVVKGVNFLNLRDQGDPVDIGARYSDEGADELVFLDITATLEGRKTFYDLVRRVAENLMIPYTVGGGISAMGDIEKLLASGADKVSINSAAVRKPEFVSEAAKTFGNQCIVCAIDVKRRDEGMWEVVIDAGNTPTGLDAVKWAREITDRGSGEILLTSMDCDGTLDGYDVPLLQAIGSAASVPLIASGGAGNLDHMVDAVLDGGADAVLAATIFHEQKYSIAQAKAHMKSAQVEVRL